MKSHRSGGSTDGFSAFLRTVKAAERNVRQEDSGTFASAGAEPDRSDFRRRMLKILRTRGAVPVPELLKETNLNFSDFTEALQAATRNELVRLHLEDGAEMAELTPLGHKLASIE